MGENSKMLRVKAMQVRVTEDEYSIIQGKADFLGIAVSDFMRMVLLHADVQIFINLDNIIIDK